MVWVRLQADVDCKLRRGAWYRLIKSQGLAAVVDVKGTPVPVIRAFIQLSNTPPRKWTVVPRPKNVPRYVEMGERYAVCPACRDRVSLRGRPSRMLCGRCGVEFAVDWEEHYLAK
jgi:DNA-directed RNA polymerase subunit RPC12/RpoP